MKLETKQNEVRLVAESDIDKFYLENWFVNGKRPYVVKNYDFSDEIFQVVLTKEKPE